MPQLSAILVPQGPKAPAFPSTDLVESAASLFQRGPQWAGQEGRRFRVCISPGTVGVRLSDPARGERNALNALLHETRGTRQVYAPPSLEVDGVRYSQQLDDPEWQDAPEFRESPPGRQVGGWSRKSRSRMVRTLAQLDWTPLYADGRPGVLGTLTYPGDWESVVPDGKTCKKHWLAFCKRYQRRWGTPLVCAWKLEFQRRGAPHLHFLFAPPRDPAFRDWIGPTWAAIVGADDRVCTACCDDIPLPELRAALDAGGRVCQCGDMRTERYRHTLAGTGLDYLKGGKIVDPKRAAVYFSKHGGAGGGKEYQHDVPEPWQEAGKGPGRFWGYRGLSPLVSEVDVTLAEYVQLRRTLRRWSESKRLTRTTRVPRVDRGTGVIIYRTVTRPTRYVGQGGLAGGTVLVNDGPAFASSLARLPLF